MSTAGHGRKCRQEPPRSITPNKKALSDSYAYYKQLMADSREGSAHYLYETTVGAALPVITTLRDLVDTGDEIHSIQGIFSGTLAYLFNVYDGERPFSACVADARERGFTERLSDFGHTLCARASGDYTYTSGYTAAGSLLDRVDRPDALFALSSRLQAAGPPHLPPKNQLP